MQTGQICEGREAYFANDKDKLVLNFVIAVGRTESFLWIKWDALFVVFAIIKGSLR